MKVTIKRTSDDQGTCLIERQLGDPKFYGVRNAAGESRLLYHVKQHLNNVGYDLVKKRMWKDGHMVDELQQYLRARKPSGNPSLDIMIHNPFWQIKGAEEPYNIGSVTLEVTFDIFNPRITQ